MKAALRRDIHAVSNLAYRRVEKVGSLLEDIHSIRSSHPDHPAQSILETIRRWLLMPLTLWPVDFVSIGQHVVSVVRSDETLQPDIQFLLQNVSELPASEAERAVAAHEQRVEKGRYEVVVRPAARLKFQEKEKLLRLNRTFRRQWRQLKALFDVSKFQNSKGIIRRRMVQERNFRSDWEFVADDQKRRFRSAFDAFCHRWHLYGMEGNKPLVLKLSVNLTAHGTMIVVPAFWSFDPRRDLDWNEITKLHRSRGITRQGPKLSLGRIERRRLAKKTNQLWHQLTREGIKGDEFYKRIKERLALPPSFTDREIRRLHREADSGSLRCNSNCSSSN